MELVLWRHADAEDGIPDETRKLTPKGLKQAERMATWLRQRLPGDVIVMASPARRAQQTAQALTKKFGTHADLGTSASARSLLAAAGWPDGDGVVVVVGHQPTLGEAAALAMTGEPAQWSVRKGAVWWLERRARGVVLRAVVPPEFL
ncbi:MAG: histidine phosphatase family protein [Burkholderiales bacterium]|nr:histidine phosphatase family protein [Burkholderiales bacterium]